MNIEQAKREISIVAYLSANGHEPVGMKGSEYKYRSPFREEKVPSFFVNDAQGKWNDFGFEGGDIIRLAMHLHNLLSVSEALQHLSAYVTTSVSSTIKPKPRLSQKTLFDTSKSTITNVRPKPLHHFVLLKYLREQRGIREAIAKRYLKLVLYDNKGRKDLFAIGWKNDSEAWELRSAGSKDFKSVTGKKDVTTLDRVGEANRCFVFESMLDFLSVLELKNTLTLEGQVIILNSTNLVKRIIPFLEFHSFTTIYTFFDNDKAGKKALTGLKSAFKHPDIQPQTFYYGYSDVNDYLNRKKR